MSGSQRDHDAGLFHKLFESSREVGKLRAFGVVSARSYYNQGSILNNLRASNWVTLLASRAAVSSAFVNQEIGGALINSKVLIPIVWDLNPNELPGWARNVQAMDLGGSTLLGLQSQVAAIANRINQGKAQGLLVAVGAILLGIFFFGSRD